MNPAMRFVEKVEVGEINFLQDLQFPQLVVYALSDLAYVMLDPLIHINKRIA